MEQWLGVLHMLSNERFFHYSAYEAHLAIAPQHIPICRQGVVAAYHVVWGCVVEQWLGVRHMLSNERQHDMLPQHLVCKYQLIYEYCNITLARNKAP